MIVFYLSIFEGELPGCALTCEVMAIGMLVPTSIRTGIRHLSGEVAVVAGHAAPPGSSGRAEVMGCFAMGRDMVEPWAVRAATALFELSLVRGRRPARCCYSRRWCFVPLPSSVRSHVRHKDSLACNGFDVAMPALLSRYPHPPAARGVLGRSLVRGVAVPLWLKGLYFLQAKGELALIRFEVAEAHDVGLDSIIPQIFYCPLEGPPDHPFFCHYFEILIVPVVGGLYPKADEVCGHPFEGFGFSGRDLDGGAVQVQVEPNPIFEGMILYDVVCVDLYGVVRREAVDRSHGGGVCVGIGG
ncbi:hypothetical protein DFH94DRAFT_687113 [Russula ochroleuca]|uniref:Uncharacterized protein n=1 Tax=Russula ochroleuca TaxID=152965 RepID=A0A9P5JUR2_9AGAM|nr:hypothetical protein DFH94DRAFT_687113 [Russula ochroleuca]